MPLIGERFPTSVFPPPECFPSAKSGHESDVMMLLPVSSTNRVQGVLAICAPIETQGTYTIDRPNNMSMWGALLGAALERNALQAQLAERTAALTERTEQLEAQALELAKARDAAEAANEAKSAFLANMSHELRTPLNAILGYAQVLTRVGDLTPQQADGLQVVQQSGEHLLTLIDDVLDLAKIEAGKFDLVPAHLHLPAFLQGIVAICRIRAEQKGLTFVYAAPPALPIGIWADEKRLRQVLINLLGNAIKFTQQGQVTLRVSHIMSHAPIDPQPMTFDTAARDTRTLRFEVIDTGVGISSTAQDKLFQPFEQSGDAQQRAEGTGLGLAISQRLLQQMHSTLQVKSRIGQGSSFWFDLTVPAVLKAPETKPLSNHPVIGYIGPPRIILVADDNLHNRRLLIDLLSPLGFRLVEAAGGSDVLEQAHAVQPDAILLDLLMPGMTGMEVTQAIRRHPELNRVVIIATSASVFDADRQQSLLAGCNAFLPKPIRLEQLLDILASQLGLTWRYAETEAADSTDDAAELTPPPAADLAALYELAVIGDLLGLQARAAQLEQRDHLLGPFARQLRRLASQFEVDQVLALLDQHLKPEQ